jgi:hypothetical protein
MTPTTKSAADTAALLERLAALEAKESERERLVAEREAAQERLAAITNKRPNRHVRDLGLAKAFRRCSTASCSQFDVPVEVEIAGSETVQYTRDPQGNPTEFVENSWVHYNLVDPDQGICPSCSKNVGFSGEPGSVNALENSPDGIQNNREAFIDRLRARGRSDAQIKRWTSRWAGYKEAE